MTIQNTITGKITKQAAFEALNPVLGAETTFRVQFLPGNTLPQNAIIEIVFPATIKASGKAKCQGIENLP